MGMRRRSAAYWRFGNIRNKDEKHHTYEKNQQSVKAYIMLVTPSNSPILFQVIPVISMARARVSTSALLSSSESPVRMFCEPLDSVAMRDS